MDFTSAYLQTADDKDWSVVYKVPDGTFDNVARKNNLYGIVDDLLRPLGFTIVEGVPEILTPVVDPASAMSPDWHRAQKSLDDAYVELRAGRHRDAITDVGSALQSALESAGFPGKTLGAQIKMAQRKGIYSGVDTKLGVALESISEWIAAVRNERSDAHPGTIPTKGEATLAVGVGSAIVAHLWSLKP